MISRPYYDLVNGKLEYHQAQYRVPGQFYGLPFVRSLGKYTDRMIPYLRCMKKQRLVLSGIFGNSFLVHELYMHAWNTKLGRKMIRKKPPVFFENPNTNRTAICGVIMEIYQSMACSA